MSTTTDWTTHLTNAVDTVKRGLLGGTPRDTSTWTRTTTGDQIVSDDDSEEENDNETLGQYVSNHMGAEAAKALNDLKSVVSGGLLDTPKGPDFDDPSTVAWGKNSHSLSRSKVGTTDWTFAHAAAGIKVDPNVVACKTFRANGHVVNISYFAYSVANRIATEKAIEQRLKTDPKWAAWLTETGEIGWAVCYDEAATPSPAAATRVYPLQGTTARKMLTLALCIDAFGKVPTLETLGLKTGSILRTRSNKRITVNYIDAKKRTVQLSHPIAVGEAFWIKPQRASAKGAFVYKPVPRTDSEDADICVSLKYGRSYERRHVVGERRVNMLRAYHKETEGTHTPNPSVFFNDPDDDLGDGFDSGFESGFDSDWDAAWQTAPADVPDVPVGWEAPSQPVVVEVVAWPYGFTCTQGENDTVVVADVTRGSNAESAGIYKGQEILDVYRDESRINAVTDIAPNGRNKPLIVVAVGTHKILSPNHFIGFDAEAADVPKQISGESDAAIYEWRTTDKSENRYNADFRLRDTPATEEKYATIMKGTSHSYWDVDWYAQHKVIPHTCLTLDRTCIVRPELKDARIKQWRDAYDRGSDARNSKRVVQDGVSARAKMSPERAARQIRIAKRKAKKREGDLIAEEVVGGGDNDTDVDDIQTTDSSEDEGNDDENDLARALAARRFAAAMALATATTTAVEPDSGHESASASADDIRSMLELYPIDAIDVDIGDIELFLEQEACLAVPPQSGQFLANEGRIAERWFSCATVDGIRYRPDMSADGMKDKYGARNPKPVIYAVMREAIDTALADSAHIDLGDRSPDSLYARLLRNDALKVVMLACIILSVSDVSYAKAGGIALVLVGLMKAAHTGTGSFLVAGLATAITALSATTIASTYGAGEAALTILKQSVPHLISFVLSKYPTLWKLAMGHFMKFVAL